jgi:hypothetical protein
MPDRHARETESLRIRHYMWTQLDALAQGLAPGAVLVESVANV